MIGLDSVVVRSASVLEAELEDEIVLLSIDQGAYYGLAATSRLIWERLAEPVPVRVLCAELARNYDAQIAVIEADTLRFLEYMHNRGLVHLPPSRIEPNDFAGGSP